MNEWGVSSLVDHILTCNLWSILELVMVRRLIEKHEKFYRSHEGKDIRCLFVEVEGLNKTVADLQAKVREKDNELNNLKSSMNSLEDKVAE